MPTVLPGEPGAAPGHSLPELWSILSPSLSSTRCHHPSISAHSPCGSENSALAAAHTPSASHQGSLHTQPAGWEAEKLGVWVQQQAWGGGAHVARDVCPPLVLGWAALTTPSRKAMQRVSSGLVVQNSRNSRRPMGCRSHRLWESRSAGRGGSCWISGPGARRQGTPVHTTRPGARTTASSPAVWRPLSPLEPSPQH